MKVQPLVFLSVYWRQQHEEEKTIDMRRCESGHLPNSSARAPQKGPRLNRPRTRLAHIFKFVQTAWHYLFH